MTPDAMVRARRAVDRMREAGGHTAFTAGIREFMKALGDLLDAPQQLLVEQLREALALGDTAVDLIEERICGDRHSQKLAGSIYEIRRRLELMERWRQHDAMERHV